jgi:hypothetical protein
MRRYDDLVDVRRGRGTGPGNGAEPLEGPEQFLWQGRLWKVHAVLAQWVETGPWWRSNGVHALLGADDPAVAGGSAATASAGGGQMSMTLPRTDLAAEREVWRVEASRGRSPEFGRGVFDLVFDWADGSWRLTRCLD